MATPPVTQIQSTKAKREAKDLPDQHNNASTRNMPQGGGTVQIGYRVCLRKIKTEKKLKTISSGEVKKV